MGILLDKEGRVIKRSSLLFDESDEVLEDKKNIKQLSIKYKKNTYKKHESISRIIEEKIDYINSFFNKIEIDKDEYLLKYIYHDIFNKEESDKNTVYSELKKLIKIDLDKIYNSIKKVNMELKK